MRPMGRPNLACRLTARQGELLTLMARGYTLADAADQLGVSERRLWDDLAWACRRLNARSHDEVVALWVGADLLPVR
jgi:DNA-binding CsgD family transcriptional regulator